MIQIDPDKLIIARANAGLTLEELAKRSGVGKKTISRLEKGEPLQQAALLGKLAKSLGKTVEDFLTR